MNARCTERPDPHPGPEVDAQPRDLSGAAGLAGLAALSATLAGCGGGEAGSLVTQAGPLEQSLGVGAAPAAAAGPVTPPVRPPERLTRAQASRFLSQAGFGGTPAEIQKVLTLGIEGWLNAQFTQPRGTGYVDLVSPGGLDDDGPDGNGVERAMWRKFISNPDLLRQRVVLALSEVFVISIRNVATSQRGFASAAFLDILERNAFGNYRDLLTQISTNAAMGGYLSFLNNRKANPATGSQPDENYARELMQLFSIGLLQLNPDGTPVLVDGKPVETYTQTDVLGMARVFTGWAFSLDRSTPHSIVTEPMRQIPARHETGTKVFLGTTIPAGTNGADSLALAVKTLMDHPNIGPFVGRQLIQRLVTSNPSPAYVARVAAAFNGNAQRPKGDMQATLRAVLLDAEARSAAGLIDPQRGKLREPMLRFMQWARLFGLAPAAGGHYAITELSNPATELGQSPLHSPSVFNFFRPGYVPPNSALGDLEITAPEFQITNETSVAGYLNFMQRVISRGIGGMQADYSALLPLAGDAAALLAELNVLLAAGQMAGTTLAALAAALNSLPAGTSTVALRRVQAAVLLVMAAPEYLVLK